MPEPGRLAERLARRIGAEGPISVEAYMAEANAHYYATRDPLGAAGDFVTAPEVSQMFGELAGLWLADLWSRAGRPANARFVELGPGRGTLAADALRARGAAGLQPPVHLVETSPVLREAQAKRVADAEWHDRIEDLPNDAPLLVIANEFFDALPVRQFVHKSGSWHERMVSFENDRFVLQAGTPARLPVPGSEGDILETSPAAEAAARTIGARLAAQGGAAAIIDYGHGRSGPGDTLQAVKGHAFADPWSEPGERDLTAHVDFTALAGAAAAAGARVFGPIPQGIWLTALGIDRRASALAQTAPSRTGEIEAARHRLTAPDQMGKLFKVLALTAPHWPLPAAF